MARILYGVQGDAGGHVARSLAIARQLPEHEFLFVGGGRVASLRHNGFDVVDVPMLANVDTDNRLDLLRTAVAGARLLTRRAAVLDRLDSVIRAFDPDLVLTDYEYFVPRAARRAGRPCISIDRQHILTHGAAPLPPGDWLGRALTLAAIRAFQMEASRYFIVSFTPATVKDPAVAEVFPPVLRPEILERSSAHGDHVIAYLDAAPPEWIRRTFAGNRRKVLVYGPEFSGSEANIEVRQRDAERFADDLAGSAYVVSHAGSNLIAEALHLGKPVLAFPVALEYEQHLNAHLLAEAGYGLAGDRRDSAASVGAFEAGLPALQQQAARYRPWSDASVVTRLRQLLAA